MAKSVDEGFRLFHERLTPLAGETRAAQLHRASIEQCLKGNFKITRFFRTGSFGNGTNIRRFSDVDYFASIPRERLTQNSYSTLIKVRKALKTRFPNSSVIIRAPAVRIPFGRGASESTEIVPTDYIRRDSGKYRIYDIPYVTGRWIKSSPDAHNAYVSRINSKHGGKLKPLVRFLKAWKYYRNVPIISFYLEMRVAKYAELENSIVYSIDVKRIFEFLYKNNLPAIQDPMGISGYIQPCSTEAKKKEAISKLGMAMERAKKAVEAESSEITRRAFIYWNLVFNNQFPKYG